MSKEALEFIETLAPPKAELRFVLHVLAFGTYSDTGMSRLGHVGLIKKTGLSKRSLCRHIAALASAGYIRQERCHGANGWRKKSAIELVGFLDWLSANLAPRDRKSLSAKLAKSKVPLVALTYKDTKTSEDSKKVEKKVRGHHGEKSRGRISVGTETTPADGFMLSGWDVDEVIPS